MPRRPATVTQADITRAVLAAAKAPIPMSVRVERDGTITILPLNREEEETPPVVEQPEPEL